MAEEIQNRIVAVVGRKGAGKSTWIGEHLRYAPRILIFDPLDEYGSTVGNRLDSIPGVERFLAWSKERDNFAARYVPDGELEEEIEEVCPLAYSRGNLCLVCEEIALYTKPGSAPPLLGKLVRTGRHRKIDLVWATQRPGECAKSVTALTDLWILFSLTEPRDLQAVAERCGDDVANRVAELGQHEFLIWDVVQREAVEDSPRILREETRPAATQRRVGRVRRVILR